MSSIIAVPRALKRRRALTWGIGAVVLAGIMLATLCLGEVVTAPGEVLQALFGGGDPGTRLVVVEWRLPRAVLGAAIGALLALSGALFQVVTRNPLGSPDILGFSAGASTGVLLVMLGGTASIVAVTTGAIVGGLASAALVFGLVAWRGASGVRVIIVGIAVTAMVGALNVMIQISADQLVVHAAAIWGVGSLNGVDGVWVVPMLVTLAVGGVVVAWLAPALRLYELGEDAAASLGVRPTALRLVAMLVGVVLVSMTISAAGPIAFIALAAPQIARRVWRSGTIPFAASALVGAILLTLSDLLAARLFAPTMLPTGLVTVAVGGIYLAWMLSSGQERKR